MSAAFIITRCPRQDGGGHPDGPWFKDTKLEYHNDGNRKLVALDAPEDPELRYQTCDPPSAVAQFCRTCSNLLQNAQSVRRLNNRTEPALCACSVNIRDLPVREYLVTANYPIEIRAGSDVGHTPHNGATRQIPNTQHLSTPSDGNTIPSGDTPTACARRFLAFLRCHTDGAVCCRGGGGSVDEDVGHVLVPGGVCPAARQPGLVIRPQPGHLLLALG